MTELYYIRGHDARRGPVFHLATAYRTVDEALDGAKTHTPAADDIIWIVDAEGNLVLPSDQVRMRLEQSGA